MSAEVSGRLAMGGEQTADWFRILSTSPDPKRRIADLTDGGLDAAIRELSAIETPNEYQADLGALCICEAVRRWRASVSPAREIGEKSWEF